MKTYLVLGTIGMNQTMNEKMFVVESVLPLVLTLAEFENRPALGICERRHYYFWFFGYVAKLPFERQIAP